jgi:hypothetical protein
MDKKSQSNIFAQSYTYQHKHILYFPLYGLAHIFVPQIMQKTMFVMAVVPIHQFKSTKNNNNSEPDLIAIQANSHQHSIRVSNSFCLASCLPRGKY